MFSLINQKIPYHLNRSTFFEFHNDTNIKKTESVSKEIIAIAKNVPLRELEITMGFKKENKCILK